MATMDKLKVAIIVLNYKGLADTLICLDSLRRVKSDNFNLEIIVVDNGSNGGSKEALSNLRDIRLIALEKNLGYSGGNNVGIKEAIKRDVEYILVLNNDTLIDPNFLIELVNAAKKGDIISPKIYFAKGFEFHKSRYKKADLGKVIWYAGGEIDWQNVIGKHIGVDEVDKGQYSASIETGFATGACMFVKREVFEKVGFFDEKYFLYLEDIDLCQRAKRAGFKITFEPKAIIWHKNASSSGGSGSKLQDYYITRNRLLFAFKYAKLKTKLAVFRQILMNMNNSVKRRALVDFITFNFGRGSFKP